MCSSTKGSCQVEKNWIDETPSTHPNIIFFRGMGNVHKKKKKTSLGLTHLHTSRVFLRFLDFFKGVPRYRDPQLQVGIITYIDFMSERWPFWI